MKLLTRIFALGVLVLSFSCQEKLQEAQLNVYQGYLSGDVKTLDPAVAYDEFSWDVVPIIYESLYQYSYLDDPYKVVPLLAADLPTYSRDRKTVTIRLRQDVYYHDDKAFKEGKGRKIKAEDFILGWKRLALPSVQSKGFWIFDGKIKGLRELRTRLRKVKNKKTHPAYFQATCRRTEGIG